MTENIKNSYQSTNLFDLNLFSRSGDELLNLLRNHLAEEKSLLTIATPNPEQVVTSRKDKTFLDHLRSFDILIPDGIGLVIASKILAISSQKLTLSQRISGREVAQDLLQFAAEKHLPLLVIGGRGYGGSKTGELQPLAPLPQLGTFSRAYWIEGYKNVQSPTELEYKAVSAALRQVKPVIVFVAFGAPYQEAWIVAHKNELKKAGVKIAMVVGGAFDVLLGKIPEAPRVLQNIGLEWLFRLWQEPWRWRRQLKLLEFIKLTFQSI